MPTLDASWSGSLRVVGDLERPDHWYLTEEDSCYFFGEYTARAGYGHSSTNQLIHNLKKKPCLRATPQWKWKGVAIRDIGQAIARNLRPEALAQTTIIPIPPSKPPDHPDYDDRMAQVARSIGANHEVREVIYTAVERDAAHTNQNHRDPDGLRASLAIRSDLTLNRPSQVLLLDDVLTTGCSFIVCKAMISEIWPGIAVFGLFVARRVIDRSSPFEEFEDLDA
jgi:hypothetical protein